MKYCVVSKNQQDQVYSITPPQSKEMADHHKDMLESYMNEHEHFIVTEEEATNYKKHYEV